jgi:(R)-2-hydroxyacyl-CoA dehydratese activating ATPase
MEKIVAGIDIGSAKTKVVLIDQEETILARRECKTLADFARASEQILQQALESVGLSRENVAYVATTGLGRYSVPFRQLQITEITCAGRAARFLFPDTECVLDMGAQSTRAIRLRENGKVKFFRSNDRCAAGSGGFLEKAAKYLEVTIDQIGHLSLHSYSPQTISSVCAVLGESEIINHVSDGALVEDILRGIHNSLADRATGLLRRVGIEGKLTVVGGVARQFGMIRALEEKLEMRIYVFPRPEFACATGAALLGLQRLQKLRSDLSAA